MVLTLLVGCGADVALRPLPADAVILAFGDSLTHGTGVTPAQSYPAVLESMIGRRVVRAGVPGEITRVGLARIAGVLSEHRPDLVLICHGGNDILRGIRTSEIRENLGAMVQAVLDVGAEVVLIGVPSRSLSLAPPRLYRDIAAAHGIALDDEVLPEVLGSAAMKSDTVHPNAKGYRRIAERVATLLRDLGAV
ncbi:MAG: arylesterase [Gammaproteobacteria bacterium]|nr:arylesterase [Gammaproteobacteria bacterium]